MYELRNNSGGGKIYSPDLLMVARAAASGWLLAQVGVLG
jgi:hypothetical protein